MARVHRQSQSPVGMDEAAGRVLINLVMGNQNTMILGNRDQATIKHPVERPRKSQTVRHHIWPLMFHGGEYAPLRLPDVHYHFVEAARKSHIVHHKLPSPYARKKHHGPSAVSGFRFDPPPKGHQRRIPDVDRQIRAGDRPGPEHAEVPQVHQAVASLCRQSLQSPHRQVAERPGHWHRRGSVCRLVPATAFRRPVPMGPFSIQGPQTARDCPGPALQRNDPACPGRAQWPAHAGHWYIPIHRICLRRRQPNRPRNALASSDTFAESGIEDPAHPCRGIEGSESGQPWP